MKIEKIIIVFIVVLLSACAKVKNQTFTVHKNCTGIYLNQGNKYYLVCNRKILDDIENGTNLLVNYKSVVECSSPYDGSVCLMVFPNDGNIKILKIK